MANAQLSITPTTPQRGDQVILRGEAVEAGAVVDVMIVNPDDSEDSISLVADENGAWLWRFPVTQIGQYRVRVISADTEEDLSWEVAEAVDPAGVIIMTVDDSSVQASYDTMAAESQAEVDEGQRVVAMAQSSVSLAQVEAAPSESGDADSSSDEATTEGDQTSDSQTTDGQPSDESETGDSELTANGTTEQETAASDEAASQPVSDEAVATEDSAVPAPEASEASNLESTEAEASDATSAEDAEAISTDEVQVDDSNPTSGTGADQDEDGPTVTGEVETTPESGPAVTTQDASEGAEPEADVPAEVTTETILTAQDSCANRPVEQQTGFSTTTEGRRLTACRDGQNLWQLDFSTVNVDNLQILDTETELYAAVGNSVLELEPDSGRILNRWLVSNRVRSLRHEADTLTVTALLEDGVSEDFHIQDGFLQEVVRFSPEPAIFSWLEQEAKVSDPEARLELDETNPWLFLEVGKAKATADGMAALALFEEAVKTGRSFYDLAGIAQELEAMGYEQLAKESFDAALSDFERRGYAPYLLKSAELEAAYNFPSRPLQVALDNQDLATADFWAERLFEAAPYVEGASAQYKNYADLLVNNGQDGSLWKTRSEHEGRATVSNVLERLMIGIGRIGWTAALAMIVAILCLHLTLLFKYWIPQGEVIQQAIAKRGKVNLLARMRLFSPRYYTMTEHLVFLLMFAATLALVGLASWHDRGELDSLSLRSGTLASAQAQEDLNTLPLQGERANFIRAYAAQIRDDEALADQLYQASGDYAPAINNLAILRGGDKALLNRAATLSAGGLEEVNVNLRLTSGGFEQGQGLLIEPSPQDFQIAAAGTWEEGLAATFVNPWVNLRDARPPGFSDNRLGSVLWTSVHILFILVVSLTIVWFFLPRPREARNAPRHWLYQLLSLLIPGSGLADEVWGFLLIIPWAVISLSTLSHLFGWNYTLGFGLRTDYIVLIILYLINLVAFILEFNAYRRRMRLKQLSV